MTRQTSEPLEFLDSSANVIITISGEDASIKVGGNTKSGQITICDGAGNARFLLDATAGRVDILDAVGTGSVQLNADTGDVTVVRVAAGSPQEVFKFNANEASLTLGASGNAGGLIVRNAAGRNVLLANGASARLTVGTEDNEGDLVICDGAGREVIQADGLTATFIIGAEDHAGDLIVRDSAGSDMLHVDSSLGDITARDADGREVMHLNATNATLTLGALQSDGDLSIRDLAGAEVIHADGSSATLYIGASTSSHPLIATNKGTLIIRGSGGREVIQAGGEGDGDIIARDDDGREVLNFNASNATLTLGAFGSDGDLHILNSAGEQVFNFDGDHAALHLGANGTDGDVIVYGSDGNESIRLDGDSGIYVNGSLIAYTSEGRESIRLDGDTGDIRVSGADTAEEFAFADGPTASPGSVVVIQNEGLLALCSEAYDRTVAGVVSGAGGLTPGMILGSQPAGSDRVPIALNGKVYCQVDASYGPIAVGDLLTTSATPGHAMKATDPHRAFGAVIGKALRPLPDGVGMIPILVSLQ